jgi:hypothetical protein
MDDTTRRAIIWMMGDDAGLSSQAIALHMIGVEPAATRWGAATPSDPPDLGRCLRLLEQFPEWKPRLGEMSKYRQWALILPRWDEAAAMMAEEVGIDWSKGRSAPETYRFMKRAGF